MNRTLDTGKKGFLGYISVLQSVGVFVLMFLALTIAFPGFCTLENITNLMKQYASMLVVGACVTIVVISGELDISVGAVLALSGIICGMTMKATNSILPGIVLALLVGCAAGCLNGIITTKGKIPSFITTLGTMMMARSLAFVVSDGKVISKFPEGFSFIGQEDFIGIPILFWIVILVYAIIYVLLRHTKFGVSVYAVGSNRTAASLSGIRPDAVKMKAFILAGLAAGIAGVLMTSRSLAIQADTGRGLEFEVMAGIIIGGTSLKGGKGNVLQTILGIFIIGMIRNGLNMSQVNIFWNDFVTGSVIILAVLLDSFSQLIQHRLEERAYKVGNID